MKRFGIDIDGTVTSPESLLPHINDYFQLNLTLQDITQYELTEVLDISPQTFGKWFKEAEPTIYKESPLHPVQNNSGPMERKVRAILYLCQKCGSIPNH